MNAPSGPILAKICATIPHDDLAIQWDVCQEVLAWEGYFPNRPASYKEDITGMLARLGNAVPEPVELGYHLCNGTPNDEHVVMPSDLANTVENHARPSSPGSRGRSSTSTSRHRSTGTTKPTTRRSPPSASPRAATSTSASSTTTIRDGDQRRIAAAARFVPEFGIARPSAAGAAAIRPAPPASSTATASRSRANDPCTSPRDSPDTVSD